MSRWVAIVNPRSGGAGNPRTASLLGHWGDAIQTILVSDGPGHATQLARESDAADGIVAVGGDGTILEILQGMNLEQQTLAIIPAGRGNSLARDLGLQHGLHGAVNCRDLPRRRIDLMRVTWQTASGESRELLSASNAGIGYPAEIAGLANSRYRRAGSLSYAVASLFAPIVPRVIELQYNDEPRGRQSVAGLLIGNTRHAANFEVFPDADYRDGSVEAIELLAGRAAQILHNLSLLSGVPLYRPPFRQGLQRVSIKLPKPQLLIVDGELIPDVVEVAISVRPSALCCLVNRGEH